MAERKWSNPRLFARYEGDLDAARRLERRARICVGYLFDQLRPGQTYRMQIWNYKDGSKIKAYVWRDVLGERARVEIFAPQSSSEQVFFYEFLHGFAALKNIWLWQEEGYEVFLPGETYEIFSGDGSPNPYRPDNRVYLYGFLEQGEVPEEGDPENCAPAWKAEPPELEEERKAWIERSGPVEVYPHIFTGTLRAVVQAKVAAKKQWDLPYGPQAGNVGLLRSPIDKSYWIVNASVSGVVATKLVSTSPAFCQIAKWEEALANETIEKKDFDLYMAFVFADLKAVEDEEFVNVSLCAPETIRPVYRHGLSAGFLLDFSRPGWCWDKDGANAVIVTQKQLVSEWDDRYLEYEYAVWHLTVEWDELTSLPLATVTLADSGLWSGVPVMMYTPIGWLPFHKGWVSQNPALKPGIVRAWYHQETGEMLRLGFVKADREPTLAPTTYVAQLWCGEGEQEERWSSTSPRAYIVPEVEGGLIDFEQGSIALGPFWTGGRENYKRKRTYGTPSDYPWYAYANDSWTCDYSGGGGRIYNENGKAGMTEMKSYYANLNGGSNGLVLGLPSDPESGVVVAKHFTPNRHEVGSEGSASYGSILGGGRGWLEVYGAVDYKDNPVKGSAKQTNGFDWWSGPQTSQMTGYTRVEQSEEIFDGMKYLGRFGVVYETTERTEGGTIPWNNWFSFQELLGPVAGPMIVQSSYNKNYYTPAFNVYESDCALTEQAMEKHHGVWVGGV